MPMSYPAIQQHENSTDREQAAYPPRLIFYAGEKVDEQHVVNPESFLRSGFHELLTRAPGDENAALAFALSIAARANASECKPLCICSLASEAQEYGALYGHGLAQLGIAPGNFIMITARHEKDLLGTLEEAVNSGAFGAIIGASGGKERLYAFAQSLRLKLRVNATGTQLLLLRHWRSGGATAAHGRWRIGVLPSRSTGMHAGYKLLGPPRQRLSLERLAGIRPQSWEMECDGTRGFHMVPLLENGSIASPAKAARHQAA